MVLEASCVGSTELISAILVEFVLKFVVVGVAVIAVVGVVMVVVLAAVEGEGVVV